MCHNKRNGGKLHGNISRIGYGNAIIGRYGGCFEEGICWVYGTGESCGTREASNGGRVRVRIIHGLKLVMKNSYTYCKNLQVIKTKYYTHAPREGLVGVNHRAIPTSTHKEDNQ